MPEKCEISRSFSATRQRVWDAWTKPDQLAKWLGQKGAKSEVRQFDLKPGGCLHVMQQGEDGTVSWGKNIYREIDPPNLLVWEQGFSNEAGDIVRAPFPMPWPLLMLTTVLFADDGQATRVTLTWQPLNATEEEWASFAKVLPSMSGGWTGSFDQLDQLLLSS